MITFQSDTPVRITHKIIQMISHLNLDVLNKFALIFIRYTKSIVGVYSPFQRK